MAGSARPGWGEDVGPNPTDCAKNGVKRSLLAQKDGGPLPIVVAPANMPDAKLLAQTIDAIVLEWPEPGIAPDNRYHQPDGRRNENNVPPGGRSVNTDRIATELLDALDRNELIEPITARQPDFDSEAAYAVSAEILRRRRTRGERPIGRKIGFTNRTIWPEYDVYTPIWGPVFDTTVTFLDGPSGSLAIGHLAQPRIEPEILLHFGSAPPISSDEAEILAHVDWIAHSCEIVQSHFPNWKFQAADTMAAFGLHGALLVGPRRPVAELPDLIAKLRRFTIALSKDGVVQARGGGANVLDSPLLATAHLLSMLAAQPEFEPVGAGEIVTTGTLTAALPIRPGETWSTELSDLELDGLRIQFN